jgi:hypothetical protein
VAKYLQRSCPKCNGYLGIVVPERQAKMPVQAINGRCLKCGYRLAWVLFSAGPRIPNLSFNSTGEAQLLRGLMKEHKHL